jgi:hypothetical protein
MGQNVKISDIKFDRANANKGSERGRYAIEASMREFGFADAGTLDKNNAIIGGNKCTEVAGEIGMDDAIVVDVDGTKPVFIRRNDLDLFSTEDDRARRLAYALNRSQQLSLEWDAEQVLADLNAGMDLSGLFHDFELDRLLGRQGEDFDPAAEWQGMPEFHQEDVFGAVATVKVHFSSEQALADFSKLIGQTVNKESKFIWFPKQERMDLTKYRVQDES